MADGPQGAQEVHKDSEHEAHDKGSWRHGRSLGLQRPFARRMLGAGGMARIARRELLLRLVWFVCSLERFKQTNKGWDRRGLQGPLVKQLLEAHGLQGSPVRAAAD